MFVKNLHNRLIVEVMNKELVLQNKNNTNAKELSIINPLLLANDKEEEEEEKV